MLYQFSFKRKRTDDKQSKVPSFITQFVFLRKNKGHIKNEKIRTFIFV